MENVNTFKVYVGDRYDDGHGKYEVVYFKASVGRDYIMKAFKKASDELGHSLSDMLCNYDDSRVPRDLLQKLYDKGCTEIPGIGEYNEVFSIEDPEGMVKFYLSIAAFFTPFEWELVSDDTVEISLPSSGYGLFY